MDAAPRQSPWSIAQTIAPSPIPRPGTISPASTLKRAIDRQRAIDSGRQRDCQAADVEYSSRALNHLRSQSLMRAHALISVCSSVDQRVAQAIASMFTASTVSASRTGIEDVVGKDAEQRPALA